MKEGQSHPSVSGITDSTHTRRKSHNHTETLTQPHSKPASQSIKDASIYTSLSLLLIISRGSSKISVIACGSVYVHVSQDKQIVIEMVWYSHELACP